jgi:hypothetical protein
MVGNGRLGFVMVDLACIRLGVAPLCAVMVGLAFFSVVCSAWLCYDRLWLTLLGFAMIGNGWLGFIWSAMVGLAWLGFAIVAMALFYGLLKRE